MKSVRFVQIFRPVKKANRTHKQVLRGRFVDEDRTEEMREDDRADLSVLP